MEIDGASHTGVDDVRQLQETLSYVPQRSKFRVFIIDEVHMLSASAFNALLKTLEEPPGHVVFVFATTELNKVPATILSRCQVFHLKCLSQSEIFHRLEEILQWESIGFEKEALNLVAAQGHGSMRDALTFLDQVIALGDGKVTMDQLRSLVTQADQGVLMSFLKACLTKDAEGLLAQVESWDAEGMPFKDALEHSAKYIRHALILSALGAEAPAVGQIGLSPDQLVQLKELGAVGPAIHLHQLFRVLRQCSKELDGSSMDRFVMENNLLEWCLDPGVPDIGALMDAVRTGQAGHVPPPPHQVANQPGAPVSPAPQRLRAVKDLKASFQEVREGPKAKPVQKPDRPAPPEKATPIAPASEASAPSFPPSWRHLVSAWKEKKPLAARVVEEAFLISYSAAEISLAVEEGSLSASQLLTQETQRQVVDQLRQLFGFKGRLSVVDKRTAAHHSEESLLQEQKRSKELRDAEMLSESENHPLTQKAIALFNGKVEKIELKHP